MLWAMLEMPLWQAVLVFVAVLAVFILLDLALRKPVIANFRDKYVFITGCDSGFGKQTVYALDKLGCHVIAGCLTPEGQETLHAECSKNVHPLHLDVTDLESIQAAHRYVMELVPSSKGLWGLVNNAGITGPIGPYEWMQREDYRQVFDVNVFGACEMIRTFLPLLRTARGRVVNMSSCVGRLAAGYSGAYCMSKFAIEAFSDGLRLEMYRNGVSVHIVEPGGHNTALTDLQIVTKKVNTLFESQSTHVQQAYGQQYVRKMLRMCEVFMKTLSSSSLDGVCNAYTHALTAQFPRRRYLVGISAYQMAAVAYLPACVADNLMSLGGATLKMQEPRRQHP